MAAKAPPVNPINAIIQKTAPPTRAATAVLDGPDASLDNINHYINSLSPLATLAPESADRIDPHGFDDLDGTKKRRDGILGGDTHYGEADATNEARKNDKEAETRAHDMFMIQMALHNLYASVIGDLDDYINRIEHNINEASDAMDQQSVEANALIASINDMKAKTPALTTTNDVFGSEAAHMGVIYKNEDGTGYYRTDQDGNRQAFSAEETTRISAYFAQHPEKLTGDDPRVSQQALNLDQALKNYEDITTNMRNVDQKHVSAIIAKDDAQKIKQDLAQKKAEGTLTQAELDAAKANVEILQTGRGARAANLENAVNLSGTPTPALVPNNPYDADIAEIIFDGQNKPDGVPKGYTEVELRAIANEKNIPYEKLKNAIEAVDPNLIRENNISVTTPEASAPLGGNLVKMFASVAPLPQTPAPVQPAQTFEINKPLLPGSTGPSGMNMTGGQ